MKKSIVFLPAIFIALFLSAQKKPKPGKYPSLLWEITGKGMKKPSYLFGTMHVSNKIAFHLSDSFYIGIKNADVVALETNPESWQEDMDKYAMESGQDYSTAASRYGNYRSMPEEYVTISTLKFYKYDTKIENALSTNPSVINNLLYRTYGNEEADFEEDTYLDMYIYQCGKKWGKKVSGVELYKESMQLMQEAYKDAAKDKTPQKERSYDYDGDYTPDHLQDAYRNGNLDQLDSINRLSSFSAAFDEKFLYRRNEIQADGIDSIIQSGSSLFVGVGAAHLPGHRGVIEILRKKGYKLRPIKMQQRDGRHKEIVENMRVPVSFHTETSEDGFFKVDVPGKFYKAQEFETTTDQRQYADMANGSYYMVTRVMTNAWLWNHSPDMTLNKVDSLLYENIPGKIISKTAISKNGYKGFDITNRTRRGDLQRYQVFVTPFEILFFKVSGPGDYIKKGTEAQKFFNSIQLKEYKNGNGSVKYAPPYGGFRAELPHEPYIGNDGSWIYDAEDKNAGIHYRVIRTAIHNYRFAEEDSFDLSLMEESFRSSEFIARQLARKFITHKGYPALETRFKDRDSAIFLTRFIIQGPHYYTLVAHGKNEIPKMQSFINSFELIPFTYNAVLERVDTSLYFRVSSPVFPENKKINPGYTEYGGFHSSDEEEDEYENSEKAKLEEGAYRNKLIVNDTTGEKIYVAFFKSSKYHWFKDSARLHSDNASLIGKDSTWITRLKKETAMPGRLKAWEVQLSDTGSSRMIWSKSFYKDGIGFVIITQTDTLTKPGAFLKNFFETFTPADTLTGINPFERKTKIFFEDMFSPDSLVMKRAYRNLSTMDFDSADLPQLKKAVSRMNWEMKKYLEKKKELIEKVGDITGWEATDYLKNLYYAVSDTIELQYTILEAMLRHKTEYAFKTFRDIVTNDPPVLSIRDNESLYSYEDYNVFSEIVSRYRGFTYSYYNGRFFDELSDSLQLTRTIFPDLLPLINLDDYKKPMMNLLKQLLDSNLVQPKDYEMYLSRFLIEAKQELKKQAIAEKKRQIEKEESKKADKKDFVFNSNEKTDLGNDELVLYARLLLPFATTNTAVKPVIGQLLHSNDKKLKYHTLLLLVQNNMPVPDTLPAYFAALDEYRYELWKELKYLKRTNLFPDSLNTHIALAKSKLLNENAYNKPDSIVYADRLPAEYKGKKGYVYFFKVKPKKDDGFWKIATVGLVPADPGQFEFEAEEPAGPGGWTFYPPLSAFDSALPSLTNTDFTRMTDTKINNDEPLMDQFSRILKKLLYSKRKSAKRFYSDDEEGGLGRRETFEID
jgi:uncharacterized protein YbaP (TraB family)